MGFDMGDQFVQKDVDKLKELLAKPKSVGAAADKDLPVGDKERIKQKREAFKKTADPIFAEIFELIKKDGQFKKAYKGAPDDVEKKSGRDMQLLKEGFLSIAEVEEYYDISWNEGELAKTIRKKCFEMANKGVLAAKKNLTSIIMRACGEKAEPMSGPEPAIEPMTKPESLVAGSDEKKELQIISEDNLELNKIKNEAELIRYLENLSKEYAYIKFADTKSSGLEKISIALEKVKGVFKGEVDWHEIHSIKLRYKTKELIRGELSEEDLARDFRRKVVAIIKDTLREKKSFLPLPEIEKIADDYTLGFGQDILKEFKAKKKLDKRHFEEIAAFVGIKLDKKLDRKFLENTKKHIDAIKKRKLEKISAIKKEEAALADFLVRVGEIKMAKLTDDEQKAVGEYHKKANEEIAAVYGRKIAELGSKGINFSEKKLGRLNQENVDFMEMTSSSNGNKKVYDAASTPEDAKEKSMEIKNLQKIKEKESEDKNQKAVEYFSGVYEKFVTGISDETKVDWEGSLPEERQQTIDNLAKAHLRKLLKKASGIKGGGVEDIIKNIIETKKVYK